MGGLLGGPKGMLPPPSQLIGGGLAPPGPPSSYAYADLDVHCQCPTDTVAKVWTISFQR